MPEYYIKATTTVLFNNTIPRLSSSSRSIFLACTIVSWEPHAQKIQCTCIKSNPTIDLEATTASMNIVTSYGAIVHA